MPSKEHDHAKNSQDKAKRYTEGDQKVLRKVIAFFFDSAYQVVTWVWIAISISSFFFFAGKPEGQGGRGMMWSVISLSLSVTVMILLLARRYFWESDDKPVDRPELSIERVYVKTLEAGKPEIIMMEIQNRGKATAHNITIYGTLVHEYSTFNGPLVHKEGPPEVAPISAAGSTFRIGFTSNWVNTAADVEAIKSGRILLFHFGKGHYEDEAGKKYPFDYCFMYDPSMPQSMMVCPTRYRPKEILLSSDGAERPEIYIQRAVARPLVAGHEKAVALWLKNAGSKSARNITVWINQAFSDANFEGPLRYTFLEPDTRPDCAPGETITLLGKSKGTIAQREIDALNSRKAFWFHFGKGMYEDDLGNSYPFDFCFMYEPTISDMRICPDRYWPSKTDNKPLALTARPEVILASAEGRCVAGKSPRVTLKIRNTGAVGAYRIELETTHFFAHAKTFKGPVEHVPDVPPSMYPVLPAGEEAEGHTEGGPPFTAQDVADIEGGKLLFINYSTGKYEDEAGNFYPFEFCVVYKPGAEVMEVAPKSFWPKRKGYS